MTVVSEGLMIQRLLGKVPSWREVEVFRIAWDAGAKAQREADAKAAEFCLDEGIFNVASHIRANQLVTEVDR